jgi:hypothetical protein
VIVRHQSCLPTHNIDCLTTNKSSNLEHASRHQFTSLAISQLDPDFTIYFSAKGHVFTTRVYKALRGFPFFSGQSSEYSGEYDDSENDSRQFRGTNARQQVYTTSQYGIAHCFYYSCPLGPAYGMDQPHVRGLGIRE